MKLPTLYKKTSGGKIEQWSIRVEMNPDPGCWNIITEHGLVDGKMQESIEVVSKGKNLGKANETTAKDQAISQAQSEWTVKLTRKGYVEELERARAGENNGAGGIRPMLAQSFSKHGDKIKYKAYVQGKLDGIRCIATVEYTDVTLWSREQKQFQVASVSKAIKELGLPVGTILDGEMYNHELRAEFEKIVSGVRKGDGDNKHAALIQYHVYDLPSHPGTFSERSAALYEILHAGTKMRSPIVRYVETKAVANEEELLFEFDQFRAAGYEGAMARNDAPYEEGKRSYGLQKLKEFDDAEFQIVGVYEGVGKMAGLALFVCSMKPGHRKLSREEAQLYAATKFPDGLFGCKLEGALETLAPFLNDESLWWGKKLTVKFQGLTGRAKVCRFPVGKTIRDYE